MAVSLIILIIASIVTLCTLVASLIHGIVFVTPNEGAMLYQLGKYKHDLPNNHYYFIWPWQTIKRKEQRDWVRILPGTLGIRQHNSGNYDQLQPGIHTAPPGTRILNTKGKNWERVPPGTLGMRINRVTGESHALQPGQYYIGPNEYIGIKKGVHWENIEPGTLGIKTNTITGKWTILAPGQYHIEPNTTIGKQQGVHWERIEAGEAGVLIEYTREQNRKNNQDKQNSSQQPFKIGQILNQPGIHPVGPRNKICKISTQAQSKKITFHDVFLSDGPAVDGEACLVYRVVDPVKALFSVEDVHTAIIEQAKATLCLEYQSYKTTDVLASYEDKEEKEDNNDDKQQEKDQSLHIGIRNATLTTNKDIIRRSIGILQNQFGKQWGIKIISLQLESIKYQNRNVCEQNANLAVAKTEAKCTIQRAKANAEAQMIQAKMEAEKRLLEAKTQKQVAKLQGEGIQQKLDQMKMTAPQFYTLEAVKSLASSNNKVIISPEIMRHLSQSSLFTIPKDPDVNLVPSLPVNMAPSIQQSLSQTEEN